MIIGRGRGPWWGWRGEIFDEEGLWEVGVPIWWRLV